MRRTTMLLALASPALATGDPMLPRGRFLWQETALLAPADPGWAALHAQVGPGWRVGFDPSGHGTRWLLPAGDAPVGATEAHARHLLERFAPALGVRDPSDFTLSRSTRSWSGGGELIGIDFRQTHDGLPVRTENGDARVRFRFDGTTQRLMAVGTDAASPARWPGRGFATLESAVAGAATHMGAGARFHGGETFFLASPRAVWRVHEVRFSSDAGAWTFRIDAESGGLLEREDAIRHVDVIGNVTGGTRNHPGAAFSMRPLPDLKVTVTETGHFANTDTAGNFLVPNPGAGGVTVTGRLLGSWADVSDASGSNLSFNEAATPGVNEVVQLNTISDEFTDAEVAGYLFITEVHRYLQRLLPSFTGGTPGNQIANQPVIVNQNLPGCIGGQFNWFNNQITIPRAAAGACNNGATQDILAHEYGHAFHDWFHGNNSPASLSEGIGDHVALYYTDQRVMGRSYYTPLRDIRDYRVGGPYNEILHPQADPYLEGAAWAGFCLDFKDNLIARLGAAAGRARAELVTIGQYERDPSDVCDAVMESFLQDDNNGTLLDGTPWFAELAAAADRHTLTCRPPDPAPVLRAEGDLVLSNGFGFYGAGLLRVKATPLPARLARITPVSGGVCNTVIMDTNNWDYLTNGGNYLYSVNMGVSPPVTVAIATAGSTISGIDLDQDGSVVATVSGALLRMWRTGVVETIAVLPGTPNCVTVDLDRGDYIVGMYDTSPTDVLRVSPGGLVVPLGPTLSQVSGIDQDTSTGDFYLTRFGSLERIRRDGVRFPISNAPELATANSLEFLGPESGGSTSQVPVVEAGSGSTGIYAVEKVLGSISTIMLCPRGSLDGIGPTDLCPDLGRPLVDLGDARPGGSHDLRVQDRGNAGRTYVLFASLGLRPGLRLPDGRTLQLLPDALFFATAQLPTIFQGFAGTIGSGGVANARVHLPQYVPTGLRLFVSGVVLNASAPGGVGRVLNTVGFTVR